MSCPPRACPSVRDRILSLAATLACLLSAHSTAAAETMPAVRDGDIIFHTSRSSQSAAVQRATGSRYSHMGIIFHRGGAPYVLEAVQTVRHTPLGAWIARGNGRHFVVKRLREAPTLLTSKAVARLREVGRRLEGRRYDLTFEWSDDRIYCSELVWKLYERVLGIKIGELQKLRELNLRDPAVRAKIRERYGDRMPLDEPAISPGVMFSSPLLETVAER